MSILELIVTSNGGLRFSIFSNPSTFVCGTVMHIQKCNTCRYREKQSTRIIFSQWYSTARPSPKRATSNRVFVIRADKGAVLSAFCDYACTVPARTGKGILPVYGSTIHSEPRRPRTPHPPNNEEQGWVFDKIYKWTRIL